MAQLTAPFTPQLVAELNEYQRQAEILGHHPYTCVTHSDLSLIATTEGWICLQCDYKQTWAWSGARSPSK